MKFSELQLNENSVPATDQININPDTEIEFVESRSRMTGTGYKDYIYRIVGTDDAIIERTNCYSQYTGTFHDVVSFSAGFFAERKEYGRACYQAAKKYGFPMDVALAIGPEFCEEFAREVAKVTCKSGGRIGSNSTGFANIKPYVLDYGGVNEMEAGIGRRKFAIISLLADASEALKHKIKNMGQKNSTRLAKFFVDNVYGIF